MPRPSKLANKNKGPLGCGKCRDGMVAVTITSRDPQTGAPVTLEAQAYCLCERGQWRHQMFRKRQYSRPT